MEIANSLGGLVAVLCRVLLQVSYAVSMSERTLTLKVRIIKLRQSEVRLSQFQRLHRSCVIADDGLTIDSLAWRFHNQHLYYGSQQRLDR